jgi:short-subunit dehydrogenase
MSAEFPESPPLAVVTGASTGIGYELAREFMAHGYDAIVAAEEDRIHAAAAELNKRGDTEAQAVQTDLATYDGVEQLWSVIKDTGWPVAVLALNAGIGAGGEFVSNDLDAELRVVKLNVVSPVHLAKRVLPTMVSRGAGRVLITSSVAATMPGPFYATYAASKSFLLSFAEAIRHELKDTGVTVTAVMPGPTDTKLFERSGMEGTRVGAMESKDEPAEVAREAYEALMKGEDHVITGSWRNKAQVASTRVMSEKGKAAIHGKLTEPGTGDYS